MSACGKPGEFYVGYDGGTGPLWDHICGPCFVEACRKLGTQIGKWEAQNVYSYPSSIHAGVNKEDDRRPCEFDPEEDPGITDNPG